MTDGFGSVSHYKISQLPNIDSKCYLKYSLNILHKLKDENRLTHEEYCWITSSNKHLERLYLWQIPLPYHQALGLAGCRLFWGSSLVFTGQSVHATPRVLLFQKSNAWCNWAPQINQYQPYANGLLWTIFTWARHRMYVKSIGYSPFGACHYFCF